MASGKYWKNWSQITSHSWVKDCAHFIVLQSITLSSVREEVESLISHSKTHTSCYNSKLSLSCTGLCIYAKLCRVTHYPYRDKWILIFPFRWQRLCLQRQTVQHSRSRTAENTTRCWGLNTDTTHSGDAASNSLLNITDWMVISGWMHKMDSRHSFPTLSLFAFQSRLEANLPAASSYCAAVCPANGHGTYRVDSY